MNDSCYFLSGTTAYIEQSIPYPQDGKQVRVILVGRRTLLTSVFGDDTLSLLLYFCFLSLLYLALAMY